MLSGMVSRVPLWGAAPIDDSIWPGFFSGLLLFLIFFGGWALVFLVPLAAWRNRVRRRGYPNLRAYLRELPRTDEEKLDAIELTLKGAAICIVGLLIPPIVLIGLVPLYYGARKIAAAAMGIAAEPDAGPSE